MFACFAAHSSLDDHLARWFGLNQSKYQWALDDYYESKGSVSISLIVFLAFRFTFMLECLAAYVRIEVGYVISFVTLYPLIQSF